MVHDLIVKAEETWFRADVQAALQHIRDYAKARPIEALEEIRALAIAVSRLEIMDELLEKENVRPVD